MSIEQNQSNVMNKRSKKEVQIHFMYIVIILSLVIVLLLTSHFYYKNEAWIFLSFSGVAVSIILSVIAIIISLIDVAGQRQQVAEISESAKLLKETVESNSLSNEGIKTVLSEIVEEKVINNNNINSIAEIKELLELLSSDEDVDKETSKTEISILAEKLDELLNETKKGENVYRAERNNITNNTYDYGVKIEREDRMEIIKLARRNNIIIKKISPYDKTGIRIYHTGMGDKVYREIKLANIVNKVLKDKNKM